MLTYDNWHQTQNTAIGNDNSFAGQRIVKFITNLGFYAETFFWSTVIVTSYCLHITVVTLALSHLLALAPFLTHRHENGTNFFFVCFKNLLKKIQNVTLDVCLIEATITCQLSHDCSTCWPPYTNMRVCVCLCKCVRAVNQLPQRHAVCPATSLCLWKENKKTHFPNHASTSYITCNIRIIKTFTLSS